MQKSKTKDYPEIKRSQERLIVVHRDDYIFSKMIRQKPLVFTLVPNLLGHPCIALERQCISGRTLSKMV